MCAASRTLQLALGIFQQIFCSTKPPYFHFRSFFEHTRIQSHMVPYDNFMPFPCIESHGIIWFHAWYRMESYGSMHGIGWDHMVPCMESYGIIWVHAWNPMELYNRRHEI